METITLKINERSKAGKAFKSMLEILLDQPGVELAKKEKSPYNPEFVKKVLKSKAEIKQGKYKVVDTENLWESLGL